MGRSACHEDVENLSSNPQTPYQSGPHSGSTHEHAHSKGSFSLPRQVFSVTERTAVVISHSALLLPASAETVQVFFFFFFP